MAKVREYQFTTGIETSTIPDPGSPSADNDTISLGYLNDKSYWAAAVASYAALRALTSSERSDRQVRIVDTGGGELWIFDTNSNSADDGSTVLEPDDSPVTGRWLKISTSGGGGGGGGGSGVEQLLQKLENERYGIFTEDLDNSIGASFVGRPTQDQFEANLLKDYVSGAGSIEIVWNGLACNDSDKNYDSATGWTATGAAASVGTTSTAGQFTIGTAAIKFDKNNTATQAGVRYDRGSQNLSLGSNSRAWCYFYLPSITDLSNVYLRVYADSTSNYQQFTQTTQFDGSAFAIGLNLVVFDLNGSSTAGGSGWSIATQMSRYQEVGVTTGTATQTYTGVAFDALYFSYKYPERLGVICHEFTIFNDSIKANIVIDTANTRSDGRLTLAASVASNISGGTSGTSRGRIYRSTLALDGNGVAIMDNDAGYSGSITTEQEVRVSRILRESLSLTYDVIVDVYGTQSYEITTVGGSTIGVSDPANQSANLKNGDVVDIFRPRYTSGEPDYVFQNSLTMSADSTHLSGITTLTLTTTGLAIGDIVCKRHLSQLSTSVGNLSANESFASQSLIANPNGIQLVSDVIPYPQPQSLWGHYYVGGISSTDAVDNRATFTVGPDLAPVGTPSYSGEFQKGRFSLVGASGTGTGVHFPNAVSTDLRANGTMVQMSFWLYYNGTNGSVRCIATKFSAGTGWQFTIDSSSSSTTLLINGSSATNSLLTVGWNHIVMVINNASSSYYYVNNVQSSTVAGGTGVYTADTEFLVRSGVYGGEGLRMADLLIWFGGSALTAGERALLFNGGIFKPVGFGGSQRYRYELAGASGQRASIRARLTRTTTAVRPAIAKIAAIGS